MSLFIVPKNHRDDRQRRDSCEGRGFLLVNG